MLTVSDPDKIILESIAKAKGISVEEAKRSLAKKKTRKRTKKSNEPTIEIIPSSQARTVDFSQVKGRIHRNQPKENVSEWGVKDVALYIREKYQREYNSDWGHNIIGSCPELRRIHDRILDIYGLCDFLVLKDYVDFIFDERINYIIDASKGVFYLTSLREDRHIIEFSQTYDYKKTFDKAKFGDSKKEKEKDNLSTSKKSIEEVFYLSEDAFLKTYGIVVCIFWLIKCQGYTNLAAATRVLEISQRLNSKGEFKKIKETTEKLSPYHESIRFPKMEQFLKSIDGRYKIDIEYEENDIIKSKFKFLEEQA